LTDELSFLNAGLGLTKANKIIKGGQLVNVVTGEIYPADVAIYGSRIVATGDVREYIGSGTETIDANGKYLVPGLIDGHIHFEVTKLSPTMFAKLMLPNGTTSIITGLDQIYGTGGLTAVRDCLNEAKSAHFKMFFGAPCKLPYTVPSSTLHYTFGPKEHMQTVRWKENVGIWEVVGRFVIGSADGKVGPDKQVWQALKTAHENRLPVYGSASMLTGTKLNGYICGSGARSDHEAYSPDESLEKLRDGLFLMIRESSVVHFLDQNIRMLTEKKIDTRRIGFCTDDVTASDVLRRGHLNNLVRRSIELGLDPIKAIQMATLTCAEIYQIDNRVGSISPGRLADILIVDNLERFTIRKVIADGVQVASDGEMIMKLIPPKRKGPIMRSINVKPIRSQEITVKTKLKAENVKVISMQISPDVPFVRKRKEAVLHAENGIVQPSVQKDVLYVAVVERHRRTGNRAVAFISGFNFTAGAMASSVSPDDNNIVSIGVNQVEMASAINEVIEMNGGQVVVKDRKTMASLPLPIGGIIADIEPKEMARLETKLDDAARELGSRLESAFMSMIFLVITGIPDFAITDKGLVDCCSYRIVSPILGPA
jgi:adenine deaminase